MLIRRHIPRLVALAVFVLPLVACGKGGKY
jgi:hypothetical protein